MTQTTEKWNSLVLSRADFWMIWRCHGIPCFHFIFKPTVKKEHLDENDFHHGCGNYLESANLKVYWYQLCSDCFYNNYEAHWQRHLKSTLQLRILRNWINIHAHSFLGKYHDRKMGKVPGKLTVVQKSEPVLWTTFDFLLYSSLSNLVFKFNLMLIEYIKISTILQP